MPAPPVAMRRQVAAPPSADRREQEDEALLYGLGQGLFAAAVVLGEVPLGVLLLQLLLLGDELGLLYRQKQYGYSDEHDRGNDHEQGLIVDMSKTLDLAVGIHDRRNAEVDNAAERAHEVYYSVALAAQGLGGDIRHQGDSGRAVGAHGDEQQAEHDDKGYCLEGARRCGIAVVDQRQQVHQDDRNARAEQDKRHALADLRARFVRYRAEQRQQEQREHVIGRHYRAGIRLVEVEGVRKYKGYDAVIHLPERADGQERKARQYGAFVIKLHSPLFLRFHCATIITHPFPK